MKKSLFSTAALLCAVSFNALQASHINPYEMSQESAKQPRCIRVITEIPVEIAGGFAVPRNSCEQVGLPSTIETKKSDTKALVENLLDSSTKKSAKDEPLLESVLQMLLALTKNLKVVPSVDDAMPTSNNTEYLPDPDYDGTETAGTFGVIRGETSAVAAAREDAAAKSRAYSAAEDAATAAEEAAKKAKGSEKATKEAAAREAAAEAARRRGVAEKAAGAVDNAAAKEVAAGKPAFTYTETTLSDADAKKAKQLSDRFARREPGDKTDRLTTAAKDVLDTNPAESKLSTNVAKANSVLEKMRSIGATFIDIRTFWDAIWKDPLLKAETAVRDTALLALPTAI